MATKRIYRNLLTCALLMAPIITACGDDGDDDDDNVPAGDGGNGDAATRNDTGVPDGGTPDAAPIDGSRPDGGNIDANVVDSATPQGDSSTPGDASTPSDSSTPLGDASQPVVGDTWGVTNTKRLVHFARANGAIASARAITGVPESEGIVGVDIRPADGSVIALSSAGKLYTVDPSSGAATLKSTLAADPADNSQAFTALVGSAYGVDFNPVADRLRVVSNTGQNLRINVDNGLTFTDTAINPDTPGLTAVAYTNSFASACRTQLLAIDGTARTLLLQDPPNAGTMTALGSLGDAAIGQVHGFDIVTDQAGVSIALVSATTSSGERVSQLNLQTGALSSPQPIALNSGEHLEAVFGVPPTTQPTQPAGELLGITSGNKLISFNRSTPGKLCSSTALTGLGANESIVGADVRPADGSLYAVSNQGKVYTVALATGALTAKPALAADSGDATSPFSALVGPEFGVGFNPVADRLRIVDSSGANLRVNVDTGATTTDETLSVPSVSAVAYTNSFAGARSTTLYVLDSGGDDLARIGGNPATSGACPEATNPNCGVVSAIGDLDVTGDVSAVNGFDIDGASGIAFAALSAGTDTTSTLYTINLGNGTASLPSGVTNGTIGGGERLRSLSIAATPTATAYAVTSANKLLAFAPSSPGTTTLNVDITGLQTNENIVGIDVRPLDGNLYAVGSTGRLYTLNTTTGAATLVASLSAATGEPFTTLPAGTYGLDFSPSGDQLRLVNGDEQSFRVIPSSRAAGAAGATFADSALNPPPTSEIRAAAYANNVAGATSTTLFVTSAETLYRQGGVAGTPSPNTGVLSEVGALGVTASGDVGFDIVGAHDGLALAAFSTDGTTSALYAVNLATGAATPFSGSNTIANTGSAPLRGLAVSLK